MLRREWHEHLVSNDLNGATGPAFERIVSRGSCRSSAIFWCHSPAVPRPELAPPTSVQQCEQQIPAPLWSSCRGDSGWLLSETVRRKKVQFGKQFLPNYSFTPAIYSSIMFCPETLQLLTCMWVGVCRQNHRLMQDKQRTLNAYVTTEYEEYEYKVWS